MRTLLAARGQGIGKLTKKAYLRGFRGLGTSDSGVWGRCGVKDGGATEYFVRMVEDAVRVYREKNAQPLSSARDALRVIEYLTSIAAWKRR
jgi:hypothetical protein